MFKKVTTTLILIASTILTGCVAQEGTEITPEIEQQFQVGVTTASDIISVIGSPDTTTALPDGQVMSYQLKKATSFMVNNKNEKTDFFIDKEGKLLKIMRTDQGSVSPF